MEGRCTSVLGGEKRGGRGMECTVELWGKTGMMCNTRGEVCSFWSPKINRNSNTNIDSSLCLAALFVWVRVCGHAHKWGVTHTVKHCNTHCNALCNAARDALVPADLGCQPAFKLSELRNVCVYMCTCNVYTWIHAVVYMRVFVCVNTNTSKFRARSDISTILMCMLIFMNKF